MLFYEVKVNDSLAAQDDAQTVVVNGKGWILLYNQLEEFGIAMNYPKFLTEIYFFTYFVKMRLKNVVHR